MGIDLNNFLHFRNLWVRFLWVRLNKVLRIYRWYFYDLNGTTPCPGKSCEHALLFLSLALYLPSPFAIRSVNIVLFLYKGFCYKI